MAAGGSGAKVVKSSGETETFDPNVITTDCIEAGVEFWTAAEVALEVSKEVFDGISGREIQEKTYAALYKRNPGVAERYKRFHSMYVRTSQNTIETFDRKRIVSSLVKETALPKEVAETIAKETEAELRRLNLDFTSGPLIREVVNVKLLEHGYESARSDYTRLGMPVYDAAQQIEQAPAGRNGATGSPEDVYRHMAESIFREYTLLKVLPLHIADAHMKGDIHVHGLEHFVTRPYTIFHDPRTFLRQGFKGAGGAAAPAKKPLVALLHIIKAVEAFSSSFSSAQGLHSLNVWLAPYLQGLSYEEIKGLAQTALFEIAQSSLIGGSPNMLDIALDYGVPEELGGIEAVLPGGKTEEGTTYSAFEEEARLFAQALVEESLKGDSAGRPFQSPRLIYRLREEDHGKSGFRGFNTLIHRMAAEGKSAFFLNMATGGFGPGTCPHSSGIVLTPDEEGLEDLRGGSMRLATLQRVSINLPRVAYRSGGSDSRLFEALEEAMGLAREAVMVKREVMERRLSQGALPLLSMSAGSGAYFDLHRSPGVIGYVGLNEAVKAHSGEELHQSPSALDLGLTLIRHMSEELRRWSDGTGLGWLLTASRSSGAARRFAMLDTGQFTDSPVLKTASQSGGIRYTSSCHMAEDAELPLMDRLSAEARFQDLNSGGMMERVKIGRKKAEELAGLTEKLIEIPIGYWSYVP